MPMVRPSGDEAGQKKAAVLVPAVKKAVFEDAPREQVVQAEVWEMMQDCEIPEVIGEVANDNIWRLPTPPP